MEIVLADLLDLPSGKRLVAIGEHSAIELSVTLENERVIVEK